MSSSSTPAVNGTSTSTQSGIIYTAAGLSNHEITLQVLADWYAEHIDYYFVAEAAYFQNPGREGLCLRYNNCDKSVSPYQPPEYAARYGPDPPADSIAKTSWPTLTLWDAPDLNFIHSKPFADMPRESVTLPKNEDGSMGNGFNHFWVGIRSYEFVERKGAKMGQGRPKYLVTVQTEVADEKLFEELDEYYTGLPEFRLTTKFRYAPGYLQGRGEEAGKLPQGLVLYQYDGSAPPKVKEADGQTVVKVDAWELFVESGDKSIAL